MRVYDFFRARVPALEHDRSLSPDLGVIAELIASSNLDRACVLNVNRIIFRNSFDKIVRPSYFLIFRVRVIDPF